MFSFQRQLTTWHCTHLLLPAVLQRRLLLTAGRAAIDRYLLLAGRTAANPQQQTRSSGGRMMGRTERQADGQTDGRTDSRPLHRPC